jgi:segregation and condensation protein A
MTYEVNLEVFQGPIDLLLHLITRQRVDIYDVSLATISEEYLSALSRLDGVDLEVATGFLVVAATLLELKSARLLPSASGDESAGVLLEERDMLLARLVECATYRDAGAWIAAALHEGDDYHGRSAALEAPYLELAPDLIVNTTTAKLATAAAALLSPRAVPELDMSHVAPIRASVRDAIADIAGALQAGGALRFEDLCDPDHRRIDVVVRFLALLELFKAGAIDIEQSQRFGDIRATWTGEIDASEVAAEAEEYTLEAGGAK